MRLGDPGWRRRLWSALLSGSLAACGVSVIGSDDPAPNGSDPPASLPDAAVAPSDGAASDVLLTPDSPAPPCSGLLGAGWSVVLQGDDGAKCPDGFASTDRTGAINATDGCACTCTTNTADPPSCHKGSSPTFYGTTCGTAGQTYNVNGDGCTPIGQTIDTAASSRLTPIPFHPGVCSYGLIKNEAKVITRTVRECAAPAARAEEVCAGSTADAGGVKACVARDGDVPCPGAPFLERTVASTSWSLECAGCTGCTNTGSCGVATIRYYTNPGCGNGQERGAHLVNGACNGPTGAAGGGATHYKWDVALSGASCVASPPAAASVSRAGLRTICCRA